MAAEFLASAFRMVSKRIFPGILVNMVFPQTKSIPSKTFSLCLLSMANFYGKSNPKKKEEPKELHEICMEREQLLINQMETLGRFIAYTSKQYRNNIEEQINLLELGKARALTDAEQIALYKLRAEYERLKKEIERCTLLSENMPNAVFCQGISSIYCKTGDPEELCLHAYYDFEMKVFEEMKLNEAAEGELYKATGTPLPEDWGKPKPPTIPLHFVFPN